MVKDKQRDVAMVWQDCNTLASLYVKIAHQFKIKPTITLITLGAN